MAALIKHVAAYRQTKPAADGMKTAKNKDAYRHQAQGRSGEPQKQAREYGIIKRNLLCAEK
jgi:hypothetical protein